MSSEQYQRIISLGRTLFGPTHESAHTFDIIDTPRGKYVVAYLIAYVVPGSFKEWKVLVEVEAETRPTVLDQLEKAIQKKMKKTLDIAIVNRSWDGTNWTVK